MISVVEAAAFNSGKVEMHTNIKLGIAALGGVAATLAVGAATHHFGRPPAGPFAMADANGDGEVTKAEWLQFSTARFEAFDRNKDGKLVIGEIPPRPREGHRGGPGGRGGPDWGDANEAPPPPPVLVPGNGAAPQPLPVTQPGK